MTLESHLIADEREVLHLYYVNGVPHIGVGANLTVPVPADIAEQITIPQAASRDLLRQRIQGATTDLYAHLPWARLLDDVRREALVEIVYNMGIGNFLIKNAAAVSAIQRGDYQEARRRMLGGTWQQQVGDRAVRIMDQLVSGIAR